MTYFNKIIISTIVSNLYTTDLLYRRLYTLVDYINTFISMITSGEGWNFHSKPLDFKSGIDVVIRFFMYLLFKFLLPNVPTFGFSLHLTFFCVLVFISFYNMAVFYIIY